MLPASDIPKSHGDKLDPVVGRAASRNKPKAERSAELGQTAVVHPTPILIDHLLAALISVDLRFSRRAAFFVPHRGRERQPCT
jgi:hypothetical protein